MKPPIFYKGKKLKANDFIGFEDYLLARHNLVSAGHGIVSMAQPRYNKEGYFYIERVSGIAPDGSPVIVEKDDYLISDKVSRNALVSTADFYIINNHPNIDLRYNTYPVDPEEFPEYAKYHIDFVVVSSLEQEVTEKSNGIYCGRYQYGGQELKEIQPPYFYTLNAAINFMGRDNWLEWTKPIKNALRKLLQSTSNNEMINYKLAELVFNYHRWPIKTLFQNCIEITWLSQRKDSQSMLEDQALVEMLDNQLSFSALQYHPKDLPAYINKLLDLDFPLVGWNLLYQKNDYIFFNNIVQFERKFDGKFEFKFLYSQQVDNAWLQLDNNNRNTSLVAKSTSEKGFNSKIKWTLTFKYEQRLALEKGWKIKFPDANTLPESIYYRLLQ